MSPVFRCPHCRLLCEPVREGDFMVTLCCDEVAERVWLCEDCGEREQHKGCSQCLPCILDESIADPRTIEMCAPELQAEIAKGLAERLRPWLRTRQAA